MSCEVCVYDPHLAPESNPNIEISAYDSTSTLLDLKHSRSRGGGDYGAVLSVHGAYELLVDDTSSSLAPTSISALNGSHALRLDVVLYPLPSGGRGFGGFGTRRITSVKSMEQLEAHIEKQLSRGHWTDLEVQGIRKLVATITHLSASSKLNPAIQRVLNRWQKTCAQIGIEVGFLQHGTSYGKQGSSVAGY